MKNYNSISLIIILDKHLKIDKGQVPRSQPRSEKYIQQTDGKSVTTATVKSIDRSSFFNGKNKNSSRNRNPASFHKHRTRRIQKGK